MSNKQQLRRAACAGVLSALLLTGCGDGGSGSGTGTLNLGVTDAPIDHASEVWVKFSGVELKPTNGNAFSIDLDAPKQINLLNLQGKDFEFLANNANVPAGEYEWMRLKVITDENTLDSYITFTIGGAQYPLYVPSGNQTGLKLNNGFTVPEDGVLNLTIDFDLRKSIVDPRNAALTYKLKPVLRLVQNENVGHIVGTVPMDIYVDDPECAGAVYLYSGSGVEPFDYDDVTPEPVASALVKLNTETMQYEYGIGFINAGDYTISFTCDADLDITDESNTLTFKGTDNVTVNAEQTTIHDIVVN